MKTTSRILTERNKEQDNGDCLQKPRVRKNSSLLISESISPECARIAGYERLSASMRMRNEQDIGYGSRKSRVYTFISKVFSFMKISSDCETEQHGDVVTREGERGKKKRSSWLPDPERRWPVQGW